MHQSNVVVTNNVVVTTNCLKSFQHQWWTTSKSNHRRCTISTKQESNTRDQ